jgi:hypothetical protein
LLLLAVMRWARTPATHSDRKARGDMAGLLALTLIGQVGALARARFPLGSTGFWLCSAALLPLALLGLFLLNRLLSAYRQTKKTTRQH